MVVGGAWNDDGSEPGTGEEPEATDTPPPWLISLHALRGCPPVAQQWAANPVGRGPGIPRHAFFDLRRPGRVRTKSFGGIELFGVAYYRGTMSVDGGLFGREIAGEVTCAAGIGLFNDAQ